MTINRKRRFIGCCPRLEIEVYNSGTKADQAHEIIRGARLVYGQLRKWGLTITQIDTFRIILDGVADELLDELKTSDV